MSGAALLVGVAEAYAAVGLGVAVAFLLWGIDRVEPMARGSVAFRPLLVPGVIILWPLVAFRWVTLRRQGG